MIFRRPATRLRGIKEWLCPALFKYFETALRDLDVPAAPRKKQ